MQRDDLLRSVAKREVTLFFQTVNLEQVLGKPVNGVGRTELSDQLRERINKAFAAMNPGSDGKPQGAGVKILVVSVGISGVHPPKAAASAFEAPVAADARRIANIQNAEADAVATLTRVVGNADRAGEIVTELDKRDRLQTLAGQGKATSAEVVAQELVVQEKIMQAGGTAASTLAKARADRWERHMAARGQLARYAGQVAVCEASPRLFHASEYIPLASSTPCRTDGQLTRVHRDRRCAIRGSIWLQLMDMMVGADVFGQTGE